MKKILLYYTLAVYAVLLSPKGRAQVNMSNLQTTNASPGSPSFSIASIRRSQDSGGYRLRFTYDGFSAKNVTILQLVQEAYGIFQDDRVRGIPSYLKGRRYDVEARVDDSEIVLFRQTTLSQRRRFLQQLLIGRFHLKTTTISENSSAYILTVDVSGLKLKEEKGSGARQIDLTAPSGIILQSSPGKIAAQSINMFSLCQVLSDQIGRPVLDKTGLKGLYSLTLRWTPQDDEISAPLPLDDSNSAPSSIFTALKEETGLKLVPSKSPVATLFIQAVEEPSEN